MKKHIDPIACADQILQGVKSGVLLTAKANGRVNSMTISWGTMGIQWNKPVFIAFVRGSRYTKPMLDESGTFTVNIPIGCADKRILSFCGSKSGRDVDKIRELGLTLEEPEIVDAPGIRQLPLTLECRVLYAQQQLPSLMLDDHIRTHYPENCADITQDYHTAYYGEIVSAYIIED